VRPALLTGVLLDAAPETTFLATMGLAGHDVVMLQQDTPSVDGLVAVRIMTGSVRLGGWGCWSVRTAGPARRGDCSVREVHCPAGCVFPLGVCCQRLVRAALAVVLA